MRLFIQSITGVVNDDVGVRLKVDSEVETLNYYNLNFKLLRIIREPRIKRAIPFQTSSIDWSKIDTTNVDGLYIRHTPCDIRMLSFLKKYKKNNPCGKVLIEFPTFPYDTEENKNNIIVWRDKFYRNYLKRYVDKAVMISDGDFPDAFGIPAIRIINGIDIGKYEMRDHQWSSDGTLRLLCVANFRIWHGIDRMITGMANYYNEEYSSKIELHLVGGGIEIPKLKELVEEYNLNDKVIFHGILVENDLDKMYDQCDIAIECLGSFRKNMKISSSLKSREYLAVGMPFIYSGEIDVIMSSGFEYAMRVPSCEKPVDINEILKFFNLLKNKNCAEIASDIRLFAEDNVDMKTTMKPVVDYYVNGD